MATDHREDETKSPPVDQELIDFLRGIFPIRLGEHLDLRAYDRQLGAQQVIEAMQKMHDIQNSK
jgi:hypothetical protein